MSSSVGRFKFKSVLKRFLTLDTQVFIFDQWVGHQSVAYFLKSMQDETLRLIKLTASGYELTLFSEKHF